MKDSPPLLQALTLSTNSTKTEKLRSKPATGSNLQSIEQSFRANALQNIKASHQSKSSTGPQNGRQIAAANGRNPLASPPAVATTGRLRDSSVRSESRILQDAGLRVSALKVAHRQPMDLSQGANVSSPYSAKSPDSKSVMKRKGLVRSATFSAGSTDTSDASPLQVDLVGRLGSRGARPSTAPAASDSQQASSGDSIKQPTKRRQLAELIPDPPFSLPVFRPSTCLTADPQLGRSRHGQRPGTPNLRAEALTASSSASSTAANPRAHVQIPVAFATSVDPISQNWPISRWSGGRTAGVPSNAAVIGSTAVHAGQGSGAADQLKPEEAEDETMLTRSSSDCSSIAAASDDDSARLLTSRLHSTGPAQTFVRVRKSNMQRPQLIKDSPTSADAGSTSQSISFGGQGVSSVALSQALQTLGSKHARHSTQGELASAQNKDGAASHMNGNTVVSCISTSGSGIKPAKNSSEAGDRSMSMQTVQDPLLRESCEVMQWFGMDDTWFEEEFVPYARRAMWVAHHQESQFRA